MPRGYSRNKPSVGQLPPGNNDDLMAKHAAGQRRFNQRRHKKPSKDNRYDREFLSARCNWCDTIFQGPHKGERVKLNSPEYYRIERDNKKRLNESGGTTGGGITDLICNKRSCIDESTHQMYMGFQERYPDRDFSEDMGHYLEQQYEERRNNTELYPEGFIDDVGGSQ